MCLILFANQTHPEYPLVIAANRDEAYARPTAPAAFWEDDPRICGGRDLEQGGTWLGVTRTGAFAAVTNFRSSIGAKHNTRSRGDPRNSRTTFSKSGRDPRRYRIFRGENARPHMA